VLDPAAPPEADRRVAGPAPRSCREGGADARGAGGGGRAAAIGYVNAGTVEFLVDRAGDFYFLEMNTRLQVEHPVTEEVTGLDLVALQLQVAAGERLPLPETEVAQRGACIECRVYAEDPSRGFLPSPGTLTTLRLPDGDGIRVESGVESGSEVSVHYDPLLFKLVARGETREAAIARMAGALEASVVEGVRTTIPFLRRAIDSDSFRRGIVHTQLVDEGAFHG
jgi:acetyl/propionyl-CoA carboxylase alpha subunit